MRWPSAAPWAPSPPPRAVASPSSASTAGWIVEYSLGHNPLLHDLVEEDFPVVDGHVEIPDRPGLGVTIDADFVKETAQPK